MRRASRKRGFEPHARILLARKRPEAAESTVARWWRHPMEALLRPPPSGEGSSVPRGMIAILWPRFPSMAPGRHTAHSPADAKVAELADALVLGASGATHGGSSPPFRTNLAGRGCTWARGGKQCSGSVPVNPRPPPDRRRCAVRPVHGIAAPASRAAIRAAGSATRFPIAGRHAGTPGRIPGITAFAARPRKGTLP